MKKFLILSLSALTCFLFAWCLNNTQVIDDCIIPEDCAENPDLQQTYLVGYWMEPFWDIEISWWIATFSSPMYETDVVEPITIRQEWDNYYFSGEDLEWEFILKDCIDWWKWDMHYYTVWVAKIRDYYYEWCWDGIEWIKMSDEDVPEDYYQYQPDEEDCQPVFYPIDHEVFPYADIMEEKVKNWFCDIESCMHTLDQYPPEWMPWDSQTQITVWCWPMYYWSAYITWYIYTSVYPDLWLRIRTPAWYDTFYVKSESPIFIREWNRISHWAEFIEVFEKSENESLENIIKKQLKNWCSISEDIISYEDQTKITSSNPKTQIYSILDNWDSYVSNNCFDDILDDTRPLIWFFESPDKTKYYKLAFTDWCAPGPCSMFDEVEVF